MDDGQPTGPKAKWWSRPATDPMATGGPQPYGDDASGSSGVRVPDDTAAAAGAAGAKEVAEATEVTARQARSSSASPSGPAADSGAAPPRETPAPSEPPALAPSEPPAVASAPDPASTSAPASEIPAAPPPPSASGPGSARPGGSPADGDGVPARQRPRPLHEPDEYSTPPYGGPGPWAPAPPVQFPTPAHGTPLPSYAGQYGPNGDGQPPGPYAPPPRAQSAVQPPRPAHGQIPGPAPATTQMPASAPAPAQVPAPASAPAPAQGQPQSPHQPQPSPWLRYDPWSSPASAVGRQPLTQYGPQYGEPRPQRRRAGLVVTAVLAMAACVAGGAVGAYIERNGGFSRVELPQAGHDAGGRAPDSVAGIAASALPGVVTLHVSGGGEQGTGTGFVLDRQGHILTNNHVVSPASSDGEISVTFSGGETARAKLVGKDSGYDLAVVKVTGVAGLTPLPLGNSDNVQVGDPVVAIGAPFDLSNTVTSGIISAKERPITAGGEKGDGSDISYVDALQTDAPINPGNSGGPLVDARARVIGINSAIRAADNGTGLGGGQSGSIGLGFAIPINQGKRVAEELINTGRATHPVIGVSLDMEYAGDGAKVGAKGADGGPSVTTGGPGARAGIRPGDVITAVDGQRVHGGEELIVKIRAHRPGDRLKLTLVRGGEERTVTLTLGSANSG